MRHSIEAEKLGVAGSGAAQAISSCVHCGFCLSSCPTYLTLGEEMDSPRGRIVLMKEALEGAIDLRSARPYIDNCLSCLACETACPSGVAYRDLITPFRAYIDSECRRPFPERLLRSLLLGTVQSPSRLRLALRVTRLLRPLRPLLGDELQASIAAALERLATAAQSTRQPVKGSSPTTQQGDGPPPAGRGRVGLLAGCAQQVLAPQINRAAERVLARNGIQAITPSEAGCCGALSLHAGALRQARVRARRNLDAFDEDLDAIVSTTAGCSSGMKEYPLLFAGDPDEERARSFAGKVRDISALLTEIGLTAAPPSASTPLRIACHDACHLAHAQSLRVQPRALLRAIGNVTLVQPAEWELCCGSAGTYNLNKPRIAAQLGRRKAKRLLEASPDLIATSNVGCMLQIEAHLRALGDTTPVLHAIEVLDRAYSGTLSPAGLDA